MVLGEGLAGGGGPDCKVGVWSGSVSCEDAAGNVIQEPVNAEKQVIPGDSAAALDAPVVAADGVQL